MNKLVRKTLEKQMQLLTARAENEDLNGVMAITEQLILLAAILDPTLRDSVEIVADSSEKPAIVDYPFNWLKAPNPASTATPTDTPPTES